MWYVRTVTSRLKPMIVDTAPLAAVISNPRYNMRYVWSVSLVAALGGLLFGYDWVVIGGAKPFFERYFQLNDASAKGWANSCALIGCVAGFLLILLRLPETRGKTLEEIEAALVGRGPGPHPEPAPTARSNAGL